MNTNKILLGLIVVVAVIGAVLYFKSPKSSAPQTASNQTTDNTNTTPDTTTNNSTDNTSMDTTTPVPDSTVATFETSLGSFQVTLDGKAAPKTVANFIKLATSDFY